MEENKEEIMKKMQQVRSEATNDLREEGSSTSKVQNVKFYGKVALVRKEGGEPVEFDLYTVEEYDYEKDAVKTRIYLDGQEADLGELMRDYEKLDPINDIINKAKEEQTKEPEQRETKVYDLNEMELEKEVEEYASAAGMDKKDVKRVAEIKKEDKEKKPEEGEKVDERKLEMVTHLQEIQGHTKVNNYQTLEQALGLTGIKKFVVIYAEDTRTIARNNGEERNRDLSRYSMIAIKEDGTAINLDNVLQPSLSEGTNSNEGRIQTDADGTTSKEYKPASMYTIKGTNRALSFENDQYGEIQVYYGEMTRGALGNEGNQFVGTQLETQNIWPTSREVREQETNRAGYDHADKKAAESSSNLEGQDRIEGIQNADGDPDTYQLNEDNLIPETDTTWRQLANNCGYRDEDAIQRVYEKFIEFKEKHPDLDNKQIIEGMEEEEMDGSPAGNRQR